MAATQRVTLTARPAALCQHAVRLLHGVGISRDTRRGVALLQRSALMRSPEAQCLLASIHAEGRFGRPRETAAARALLMDAASNGCLRAQVQLSKLLAKLSTARTPSEAAAAPQARRTASIDRASKYAEAGGRQAGGAAVRVVLNPCLRLLVEPGQSIAAAVGGASGGGRACVSSSAEHPAGMAAEALRWARRAAAQGASAGQFQLALLLHHRNQTAPLMRPVHRRRRLARSNCDSSRLDPVRLRLLT